jgi:ribosome-binding protein aMBF1 (putative translation factor)
MDTNKQTKLEQEGWRISDATDFLNLSPEENILIDMRINLSQALQQHRKNQKLSQIDLAKRLGSSQSRIAKMEAADPSVSFDLLIRGLLATGANNTDIAKAINKQA